ncbi:MAG: aspartyl/glutamyl-tRNA amidotransferase subunit C [Oscillospiraceae bacterium]|jgi:aspartyl/glutamyl-tRNA(Asn/Gln) amidotransferase C subunit|nr:aspartyl/glutamyl-tRNA amidotransferase subunit C [Oscillospiraceae bacterium]
MITTEELRKIAGLAKLSLDGADLDALAADIGGVIDFADAVSRCDLTDADLTEYDEDCPLRGDEVRASRPVEQILANAAEARNGYFIARGKGGVK